MREGDAFLDIGAGDGAPTLAAALLYPKALRASRGVEIVAPLVERARRHRAALLHALGDADAAAAGGDDYAGLHSSSRVQFQVRRSR